MNTHTLELCVDETSGAHVDPHMNNRASLGASRRPHHPQEATVNTLRSWKTADGSSQIWCQNRRAEFRRSFREGAGQGRVLTAPPGTSSEQTLLRGHHGGHRGHVSGCVSKAGHTDVNTSHSFLILFLPPNVDIVLDLDKKTD